MFDLSLFRTIISHFNNAIVYEADNVISHIQPENFQETVTKKPKSKQSPFINKGRNKIGHI